MKKRNNALPHDLSCYLDLKNSRSNNQNLPSKSYEIGCRFMLFDILFKLKMKHAMSH